VLSGDFSDLYSAELRPETGFCRGIFSQAVFVGCDLGGSIMFDNLTAHLDILKIWLADADIRTF
jgi:hypothetical protein